MMPDQVPDGEGEHAALRDSQERLRLIVENARNQAIFIVDPTGVVLDWREGAEAVFGYRPAEIVGCDGDVLFLPEDRAAGAPERERAIAGAEGKAPDVRWHLRGDGRLVFIDGVVTALRDSEGGLVGFLKIGQDVTERHVAERRQRMLLDELQHRVRNTLAMVRSIVRRTAEHSDSVEEMADHLQGRIDAFARAQAAVTRDFERGIGLDALIADELLAHAVSEGERLTIEGPEILLAPKAAEALSLAVHELTTNAVKYGALGVADGVIAVRWERFSGDNGDRLDFVWEERGRDCPFVAVEPARFGFEFLQRTLPYELDAETEIEFLDDGLRFSLHMPLPSRVARAEEAAEESAAAIIPALPHRQG
jgi:PAS domain S-box-containing protein